MIESRKNRRIIFLPEDPAELARYANALESAILSFEAAMDVAEAHKVNALRDAISALNDLKIAVSA